MNLRHRHHPHLVLRLFRFVAALALGAAAGTPSAAPPFPAGIWRTEGYGEVLEVRADRWRHFEVTAISCIEREPKPLAQLPAAVGSVVQRSDPGGAEVVTVRRGISRYRWRRLDGLPPSCIAPPRAASARSVAEIVAQTFDEHYAFFALRGVDWAEVRRKADARLTAVQDDDALAALLAEMIAPLADRHVRLTARGRTFVSGGSTPPGPDPDGLAPRHSVLQPALKRFLSDSGLVRELKVTAQGQVWWGWLDGRVGYLALPSLWGFSGQPSADQDLESAAAEAAIDEVLRDLGGARGMVIDLRVNGGGSDAVGMAVAGAFADRERTAFSKQARDGAALTPAYDVKVTPRAGPRFERPVVVLTGPLTASGAEVLALGLRVLPHVRLLGGRTMGLFSDTLYRRLPNGWDFTLSNEIYRTPAGEVFEGVGLPPDLPSEAPARPTTVDERFGRDIRRARELLSEGR